MELYYLIKHWKKIVICGGGFFIFFIILLCSSSSGGNEEVVAGAYLTPPFEENINYSITSHFGTRIDPIDKDKISFHKGIDLSAPAETNIVASADGKVIEVDYQENGLGNYVYMEHDLGGLTLYTIYGHMLDDSIVVSVGDELKCKDKIGTIGSSGKSTGIHIHFMVTMYQLSYEEKYLIDPILVVEGL